jgi:hypothetical protein
MNGDTNTKNEMSDGVFLRAADFVKAYPRLFTLGELNWLIKNRGRNGFESAVRKIGQRKIYISVADVMAWMDKQKG